MNPVTEQTSPLSAAADAAEPQGTDGRAARWESHRLQRRTELIRAARHAVHALGPEASMEEIAGSAGTSKSVFYRYFGDKSGLQQAVGEVVLNRMQSRIREAAQEALNPAEGLFAMVNAYLQMAETSPNVYAFVTQRQLNEGTGPVQDAAFGHFLSAVTDMIAEPMSALLREQGLLLDYWPRAAIGLVRAAGEQWLMNPSGPDRPTRPEMATTLTAWLVDGVRPMVAVGPASAVSTTHQRAGAERGTAPIPGKDDQHD
ncbi:TetR/AcrR family transcriptional regulator [Arthrobacter sp. NPDC090010]|uniref:TetR/AcrR family transcriptional regulator n=1 Tax=Arthrobacter sp. NPDC090010 TaxID=3363942 RepID=UPI003817AA08